MRIDRTVLKVLKGLAEYLDMPVGELVEGVVLHALDGRAPFTPETLVAVERLREVYGLQLRAEHAHLPETDPDR